MPEFPQKRSVSDTECAFWFSLQISTEIFVKPRTMQYSQYKFTNVKCLLFLFKLNHKWILSTDFSKLCNKNFTKSIGQRHTWTETDTLKLPVTFCTHNEKPWKRDNRWYFMPCGLIFRTACSQEVRDMWEIDLPPPVFSQSLVFYFGMLLIPDCLSWTILSKVCLGLHF